MDHEFACLKNEVLGYENYFEQNTTPDFIERHAEYK